MDDNLKKIVKDVLEEFPKSRDSDWLLIEKVLEHLGIDIIINKNGNDLPSAESITRCRRFFQNKVKKYEANKDIDSFRIKKEKEFKKRKELPLGMMTNSQFSPDSDW
jgi:hypothetical protein